MLLTVILLEVIPILVIPFTEFSTFHTKTDGKNAPLVIYRKQVIGLLS